MATHPDKTFIGRVERGFEFLGYQLTPQGLSVAPAAWQRGLDGTGVKVAVLDTGIDTSHPDLATQVAAAQNFTDEEWIIIKSVDPSIQGTPVFSPIKGRIITLR